MTPADFLQGEAALAQVADDGDFGQVVQGIDALVAFPAGDHDAALIPPLQLTRADAGQAPRLPWM